MNYQFKMPPEWIRTSTLEAAKNREISTRLERIRERLWRRVLQAKREGARFVVIDLRGMELAIASKCEIFGKDGDGQVLIDEGHD